MPQTGFGVGIGLATDRPMKSWIVVLMVGFAASGCAVESAEDDADGEEEVGTQEANLTGLAMPTAVDRERAEERHPDLDPGNDVPRNLLYNAVAFYDKNIARVKNKRYLGVIDFAKHSGEKRFFIVNMESGAVSAYAVAHGSGSDPSHSGYVKSFSNVSGSNASSNGFYLTAETYQGKNGYSLRLDGASSTNSNARARAVVIHGASYVTDSASKQGRSWGCPAVSFDDRDEVINRLKGGAVIYADK